MVVTQKVTVHRVKQTIDNLGGIEFSEPFLISETTFLAEQMVEKSVHYFEGEISEIHSYTYDGVLCKEEKIEHIEYNITELIQNEYDTKGRLIHQNKNYGIGSDKTSFTYEDDLLLKRETFDDEGNLESYADYEYENKILKNYEEYSYGELILKRERTFENGIPIGESQWSNETGKNISLRFTNFQTGIDPSYVVHNDKGELIERIEKKYNEAGKLLSELIESKFNGYQKHYTQYSYDELGNLLESTTVDANETVINKVINVFEDGKMRSSEHFEAILYQGSISHYTDYYSYT